MARCQALKKDGLPFGSRKAAAFAKGEDPMPLIQVRVIKDVFSKEQKKQMITKLTDTMVSIEGEAMRGVTWCVVEEVESGDWGIGGQALTTEDVHALARGKAA
jgi:4-oxalocrotonate tautomerase